MVTTWIAIEGIILRETCQTEKDKYDLLNQNLHPKMNLRITINKLAVTRSMGWRLGRARDRRGGDRKAPTAR